MRKKKKIFDLLQCQNMAQRVLLIMLFRFFSRERERESLREPEREREKERKRKKDYFHIAELSYLFIPPSFPLLFILKVTCGVTHWIIHRSYTDFTLLNSLLATTYPDLVLPKLSRKAEKKKDYLVYILFVFVVIHI